MPYRPTVFRCAPFVLATVVLHTLCLLGPMVRAANAEENVSRPNFVFILADDQGWSEISTPMDPNVPDAASEYFETPNMQRMAVAGMRFSSAYSPAPLCTPTRRSIQCGMTPARQRGTEFVSDFDWTGRTTIATALKSVDPTYCCAHFGKYGEQMVATPEEIGYDESDGMTGNNTGGCPAPMAERGMTAVVEDPKLTASVTSRAIDFMRRQAESQTPFYVQVSYYATHLQVQTSQAMLDKYTEKGTPDRAVTPGFAGMLEELDIGVGRILDAVDGLGISGHTYIIYTADNGGRGVIPGADGSLAPPNRPLNGAKHSLYEGGIRVPMLTVGPGVKANSRCDVPVVAYDLLPTLYDLAGGREPLPPEIDGGSWRPLLENGGVGEVERPLDGLVFHRPRWKRDRPSAIRVGDWKLLLFWGPTKEAPRAALFNLAEDIGEQHDLSAQYPEKTSELKRRLVDYLIKVDAAPPFGKNSESAFRWATGFPPLPGTVGLGGALAGTHHGALIVAGGANFPVAPPWEDGQKIYHDTVYVLEPNAADWQTGFALDRPLAYGASVSTDEGVVLIGGCDAEQCYDDVVRLEWDPVGKTLGQTTLPPLPEPSAYLVAARIDDVIYVVAGQRTIDPASTSKAFWSLDLSKSDKLDKSAKSEEDESNEAFRWRALEPCPGPARIKAVATVQRAGEDRQYFYLYSGVSSTPGEQGQVDQEYLTDAWRFDPSASPGQPAWRRMAELFSPVAAGSAVPQGQSHVLVFSGSTGRHVHKPIQDRPLFTRDVLAHHTITDTWVYAGTMPEGVVTTSTFRWGERTVVASGEVRPGVRTPQVQVLEPPEPRRQFGWVNYAVLVGYLCTLVVIGVYFSRREKGTGDFFLAGGRIPWWAAGLSIYATQLSAITFISTPAVSYARNWLVFPGALTIFLMAPIVIWFYLPFFRRLNITTAYEYLERRFDLRVRLFGSASFVTFQFGRMAVVVYLPALALSAVTGLNIYASILIMGVLSTVYTVLGGMEAVVWTDVVQVLVLLGGMLLSLAIILFLEGGPVEIYREAAADAKLTMWHWTWDLTAFASWTCFLGSFGLQFGPYTTDQAVIQRYLTTKDEKAAARGIWLNSIIALPFLVLFFALGTCLYVFFKHRPELLAVGMTNDEIFPLFVARQLPMGLSGLVIAGVFAASMSSLDSGMHSVATAVTTDFYRRFHPEAKDQRCLGIARAITIVAGFVAVLVACTLARYDIRSLFFLFQKLLGVISSALVGIFILGIFTRRSTAPGVLAGAVASIAVLIYVTWFTPLNLYFYTPVGIGTCVVVGYLASLVLPSSGKEVAGLTFRTMDRLPRHD